MWHKMEASGVDMGIHDPHDPYKLQNRKPYYEQEKYKEPVRDFSFD